LIDVYIADQSKDYLCILFDGEIPDNDKAEQQSEQQHDLKIPTEHTQPQIFNDWVSSIRSPNHVHLPSVRPVQ